APPPARVRGPRRAQSAAPACDLAGAQRRRTACFRRHFGGNTWIAPAVANVGPNRTGQRCACLMGVDGRATPVGRGGYNRERTACAPCIDLKPTHHPARPELTAANDSAVVAESLPLPCVRYAVGANT